MRRYRPRILPSRPVFARCLAVCLAASLFATPAAFAQGERAPALTKKDPAEAEFERKAEAMLAAVVRVRMRAVEDARSSATLGPTRTGSGIVIEPGWVLTIGYLVIEPDAIEVTAANRRTLPATLVGYDHASGLALLKVQGDLGVTALALGDSTALAVREPVIVAPFGGQDAASLAQVTSRRRFSGSWEYMLDSAIFTAPPTESWAGAALVNRRLELVGVGSLLVRSAADPDTMLVGNMFVPTDLLKPILAQLKSDGRAAGPQRPWLGLATEEIKGRLLVTRVSPDSPAEQAGIRQGDVVLSVAGQPVTTHVEFYERLWKLGAAGVEVPMKIVRGVDEQDVRVRSIDRFAYFKAKKPL